MTPSATRDPPLPIHKYPVYTKLTPCIVSYPDPFVRGGHLDGSPGTNAGGCLPRGIPHLAGVFQMAVLPKKVGQFTGNLVTAITGFEVIALQIHLHTYS